MLKNMVEFPSLENQIVSAYDGGNSFRKIGKRLGVSCATVRRMYNGIEPKSKRIRDILHLQSYAPAPVCLHCGIVHVAKRCPLPRKLPEPWEGAVLWLGERMKARN